MATLVITRPAGQETQLVRQLEDAGHGVIHRPLMNIVPVSPIPPELKQRILNLDEYDAVISISANATQYGLELVDEYWPQMPVGLDWYAVGPASATGLQAAGLRVRLPTQRFDSEGLLALPSLRSIEGRKILIWRGIGGRETLASTLTERGASVHYAELYQRQEIRYSAEQWQQALGARPWLVLSSGQALDIVREQVPELERHIAGLILPSQRVAEGLDKSGFEHILVPDSARDADVLRTIEQQL